MLTPFSLSLWGTLRSLMHKTMMLPVLPIHCQHSNEWPTSRRLAHDKLDRPVLAVYASLDPTKGWSEDWAELAPPRGDQCNQSQPASNPQHNKAMLDRSRLLAMPHRSTTGVRLCRCYEHVQHVRNEQ